MRARGPPKTSVATRNGNGIPFPIQKRPRRTPYGAPDPPLAFEDGPGVLYDRRSLRATAYRMRPPFPRNTARSRDLWKVPHRPGVERSSRRTPTCRRNRGTATQGDLAESPCARASVRQRARFEARDDLRAELVDADKAGYRLLRRPQFASWQRPGDLSRAFVPSRPSESRSRSLRPLPKEARNAFKRKSDARSVSLGARLIELKRENQPRFRPNFRDRGPSEKLAARTVFCHVVRGKIPVFP